MTNESKSDEQKLPSVFGEVTYDDFKKIYASIFEAVEKREHFVKGSVTFKFDTQALLGVIEVRTLTKKEQDFMGIQAPLTVTSDSPLFAENSRKLTELLFLFSLKQLNGEEMYIHQNSYDLTTSYEKFIEIPVVKAKMEFLGQLSASALKLCEDFIYDVNRAFNQALRDALVNPLNRV